MVEDGSSEEDPIVSGNRGWSAVQTSERFFVTEATVASWMIRLDEDGPSALVQAPEPVNGFPDFVAPIVRRLRVLCPAMGTARIAAVLSRAGLHLGRTTVRRMLKRRPRRVASAATVRSERRIRSSRPNHIWLVDLTTVPTLAGFWISWLPCSLPQRWPFCCWVAVGVDHFSRRIVGVRVFRGRPTAGAMSAFLAAMIRAAKQAPRHLITDRGREFTARSFRRGCRRADTRRLRAAIRGSFPTEVTVCALAAQHAARRAIPVAALTLGPILPHWVRVATAFAPAKTAPSRDPRSLAAFSGPEETPEATSNSLHRPTARQPLRSRY